jgi:hypothetical protein
VSYQIQNLNTHQAGISAKAKRNGSRCPFTQNEEPQFAEIMKRTEDQGLIYDMVSVEDDILPNLLSAELDPDRYFQFQHREEDAGNDKVEELLEKLTVLKEPQIQMPVYVQTPAGDILVVVGFRRTEVYKRMLAMGGDISSFNALLIQAKRSNGTQLTDLEWKNYSIDTSAISNRRGTDVAEETSFDAKARALQSKIEVNGWDEDNDLETMHQWLRDTYPVKLGPLIPKMKTNRTKIILRALGRISSEIANPISASDLYKKFWPRDAWKVNVLTGRTLQRELGTAGARYLHIDMDPFKSEDLYDPKSGPKDLEVYMEKHKRKKEDSYKDHIKTLLGEFTLWNKELRKYRGGHVITKLMIPKSRVANWDKDRAWEWRPMHVDGPRFVEIIP